MKPINFKPDSYAEYNVDSNKKRLSCQIFEKHYKNIFAKEYALNWSEVFVISKIKNKVPWTYVINDLNGDEIIKTSHEKELHKTNQDEFRIEKVIKRRGNKLYVKWKGYDSSFHSWIGKKRHCIILNHIILSEETFMSKLIYLIMQQKQI